MLNTVCCSLPYLCNFYLEILQVYWYLFAIFSVVYSFSPMRNFFYLLVPANFIRWVLVLPYIADTQCFRSSAALMLAFFEVPCVFIDWLIRNAHSYTILAILSSFFCTQHSPFLFSNYTPSPSSKIVNITLPSYNILSFPSFML